MNPSAVSFLSHAWGEDSTGLVLILLESGECDRAVQCDKNLCSRWSWRRLFPDPPLPLPNEPGDAGPTAAANGQLAERAVHMGCAQHRGPKCLLIKSQPGLEPALPTPCLPGTPHTAQGEAAPWDAAQPTGSGENTTRERQEDISASTKAQASAADGWAHSSAQPQRGPASISRVGCEVKLFTTRHWDPRFSPLCRGSGPPGSNVMRHNKRLASGSKQKKEPVQLVLLRKMQISVPSSAAL